MIADNFKNIRRRITLAARKVGRDPADIRLVAVTKEQSIAVINEGMLAGSEIFGENKIQDAKDKIACLSRNGLEWHFIGHLQKNKVKYIFNLFSLIHSVDSFDLAEAIHERADSLGLCMPILLQVNISGEASKFGVDPKCIKGMIQKLSSFKGLNIRGFMAIPPFDTNPERSRPYYVRLRQLRDDCSQLVLPRVSLDELSMGMSNDYEVAVEEGATLVRVGTALFGTRPSKIKNSSD